MQTPLIGSYAGNAPTVVLVHGEFADASSWGGVSPALQAVGLDVIAPANPLRGLAADAIYIAGVARDIDSPVLLVGHSYGGAVITEVGDLARNTIGLIYVAAFVPDAGESVLDLLRMYSGSLLLPALRPATSTVGGERGIELTIRSEAFPRIYDGDLPAPTAAALAVAQRPIAARALEESARHAAWKKLPSWYAIATADLIIPADAQRFMARRAGARTVEIAASHAIMLAQPAAVTELIRAAALG